MTVEVKIGVQNTAREAWSSRPTRPTTASPRWSPRRSPTTAS
ncbi:hypothetical protein [Nocardioides convexus]|nr:hypothetical protein [Nocardioides convexus]